jgi:hypothetical protein
MRQWGSTRGARVKMPITMRMRTKLPDASVETFSPDRTITRGLTAAFRQLELCKFQVAERCVFTSAFIYNMPTAVVRGGGRRNWQRSHDLTALSVAPWKVILRDEKCHQKLKIDRPTTSLKMGRLILFRSSARSVSLDYVGGIWHLSTDCGATGFIDQGTAIERSRAIS